MKTIITYIIASISFVIPIFICILLKKSFDFIERIFNRSIMKLRCIRKKIDCISTIAIISIIMMFICYVIGDFQFSKLPINNTFSVIIRIIGGITIGGSMIFVIIWRVSYTVIYKSDNIDNKS